MANRHIEITLETLTIKYELRLEKTGPRGFQPGAKKLAYTVTEAGMRLEILAISRRGTVLCV